MVKTKYKHLFFDLDNTLFDFDACAKEALAECYQKYMLDTWFSGFSDFMDRYVRQNDRLWLLYKHGEVKKDEVKYGRFQLTLAEKQVEDKELANNMAEDFLLFCTAKNILVNDALEVVKELHQNYFLHIISNGFTEVQHKKLNFTGLSPYFTKIILSESVQAQKPSPKIFHHALSAANARKSESLMIGDNWDADIMGAKKYGIDQAYFNYHDGELPGEANFHIRHLKELLDVL